MIKSQNMPGAVNEKLCCPTCKGGLNTGQDTDPGGMNADWIFCDGCGRRYRHTGAYIDFLEDGGLKFRSRREKFFRALYARSYTTLTNMMFIPCGGARSARNEVMNRIPVRPGDAVLETGIGYGENFLWLARRYMNLKLYGLDIQKEMLTHCVTNLDRWKITAEIARADAQFLPYRDSSFDVVFHLGAINLFEDKGKAIREMIRVARPGTHIVIADETEKAGRLFSIFTGHAEKVVPPVNNIPSGMRNVSLSTIWRGYGYIIEFDVVK
ncbi:MAG: class I SAM-dependent methyltransferase [Bacteroidota bacterium]|nr:class I SAM-dependent methyltransferase [Bacteroidota bacterium]